MGFALQNRGALFSLDPTHPNALQARKRPFHTIIPAFMERGDVHIGFGIMGGSRSDSLPAGGSYPPISVTVSVAGNVAAPSTVLNQALLSGSLGQAVASDSTVIQAPFADVSSTDLFLPAIDLLGRATLPLTGAK